MLAGMLDTLFGGNLIGWIAAVLIGIGGVLMSIPSPEPTGAKWCFHLAAGLLFLKAGLFLVDQRITWPWRLIVSILAFSAIGFAWTEAIRWVNGHLPNLVYVECNPHLFLDLKKGGIFRETELEMPTEGLWPLAIKYRNEAMPPKKVGLVNVNAHITFQNKQYPELTKQEMDHGCWLDEPSPYISFNAGETRYLIIGTFRPKKEGGFEPGFIIYGRNPNGELLQIMYSGSGHYKIRITLNAGKHGEFGRTDDFRLKVTDQHGYEFSRWTEDDEQRHRIYVIRQFEEFIKLASSSLSQNVLEQMRSTPMDING